MDNIGLLLIDIQNDYFPGGKMEVPGSEQAAKKAKQLLEYFRNNSLPIFHVQHISLRRGANFFLPNTQGSEIHQSVLPEENELVIQKHFPNCFRETEMLSQLRKLNIQKLIIAGMMTQMCIDASVRAATDYGFECWVSQDGCAAHEMSFNDRTVSAEDVHTSYLAALHGTYGRVMETEKIIMRLQTRMK